MHLVCVRMCGLTHVFDSTRSISCCQIWKRNERKLLKISTALGNRTSTPSCMRCVSWIRLLLRVVWNDATLQLLIVLLIIFRQDYSVMLFNMCWCTYLNRHWSTSPRRHVSIKNQRLWKTFLLQCCLTSSPSELQQNLCIKELWNNSRFLDPLLTLNAMCYNSVLHSGFRL